VFGTKFARYLLAQNRRCEMRYNNITKIAWLSLLLGLAFAQENTGTQKDSTNNYRNREQYKYQEHVRNQGDTIKVMSHEKIVKGDTMQIQTTKSVKNPAVQSEMTVEKTISKDGKNTVKIEKTVTTPKDTVTIQKEVGSATRDTLRTKEHQGTRPDTLKVKVRKHLRSKKGISSGNKGTGTGSGTGAMQKSKRGN
jgi:hypothetical protein